MATNDEAAAARAWPVPCVGIAGKDFGTHTESPAADAAAWTLVGLLCFCIACFLVAGIVLRRQRRRPGLPEEKDAKKAPGGPKREPWQKADDWWKK
jgi:hypothetical protein